MIPACVWNWGALQYEYYIIPNEPDFGGYGAARGLKATERKSDTEESISFDDILPSLPEDAIEVGSGLVCVGELYNRPADTIYPRIDFSKQNEFSVNVQRLLSLFETANHARENPPANTTDLSRPTQEVSPPPQSTEAKDIIVPEESAYLVWETLLPILTGVGLGIAVYQYVSKDVRLRDVLLIWGAGAGFGLAIGSEIRRARFLREG